MRRVNLFIISCLLGMPGMAQIDPVALQQWKDQKYSLFIHFGIYSQLGGVWNGHPVTRGLSEQIQAHAGIYSDTYARVARQFNPLGWNADSIALLAKAAGMHSIVVTSKHHDGFAMFNTATTDFNVVAATPYKRDVLKELSAACQRHGIRFGIYFSLIDWHYPEASPISSHNSDYITPEHHGYNKQQITELLTNYGPVSELWFDMGSQSLAQSKELRELVHRLQPNCMIGSRIGNNMGDFTVMGDNQEPDYIIGVPWQSPASFFDETWGYRSWQQRGSEEEKYKEKLTSLIHVVSRGGNFLLNIGPRGDGTVVEFERNVLLKIGAWLQKNQEAVYGTQPDPFHVHFDWGSITSRAGKLYLHLLAKPANNSIVLPGIKGVATKAYVLGEGTVCKVSSLPAGITVQLPAALQNNYQFKVIVVEIPKGYTVPPVNIIETMAATNLNKFNAFNYYSNATQDYNTCFTTTIKQAWTLQPAVNTTYTPTFVYTEEEKGKSLDLTLNGIHQVVTLSGDEPEKLNTDLSTLTFGPLYQQGPLYSGVGGTHASLKNIEITKAWPAKNGHPWALRSDYKNGGVYWLPADMMTAYYLLQEIQSPKDQLLLVRITAGDAVMVFLNGQQLFIQHNLLRKDSMQHTIQLNLQPGNNQLAVKYFNNFHKQTPLGIDYHIPQVLYKKQLAPLVVKKNAYYPVTLQRHEPFTPHDDLELPNLQWQFSGN